MCIIIINKYILSHIILQVTNRFQKNHALKNYRINNLMTYNP